MVLEFSIRERAREGERAEKRKGESLSKERWKRKRKDGMNTKRDGERGGWRWKAGVVGLTKKEGGGVTLWKEKGKKRNGE